MNDSSATLPGCLPFVLWIVVIIYACFWLATRLQPRNALLRRTFKNALRITLIEPFRKPYRGIRWLTVRFFAADPNYRFHQLYLERYPVTPLELYEAIEAVFAARQIIGVQVSRTTRFEWHLLSVRRIYLLISFGAAACFISGIPVGTGLYVTWRYSALPSAAVQVLFQVPFLGVVAERLFAPPTFYRTDLYVAFEQAIRSCVLEATNHLAQQGVRPLGETETRPLLREFYG
jgi:hypothetical protein